MEDETDEGGATTAQDAVAMAAALPSTSTSATVRFPQGFRELSPTLKKSTQVSAATIPTTAQAKAAVAAEKAASKVKKK